MKRNSRVVVIFAVAVLVVTGCYAQQVSDEGPGLAVRGLEDEVIVRRDGRSIPYIQAKNESDLYFAQGYETARDRLWQMDLLRRVARGRLAELFGNAVLEQDKRWRTFGFASIAEEDLKLLNPELRKALDDYARGVNAYIGSLDDSLLPVEFQLLKYKPEPWKPSDTIVVGKILADALSTTWSMDLRRLEYESLPEDKRVDLVDPTDPADVVLFGKDREAKVIRKEEKSVAAVVAGSVDVALLKRIAAADEASRKASLEIAGMYAEHLAASNNWVISGKRTLDGKPLLANDPHLRPGAPGIWYLTSLSSPGLRAAGVTFPGVPGIVLGHNENFAWGATNVGPDVQDIYFEEFNDRGEYKTESGWKKAVVRKEVINVRKGLGPETDEVVIDVVETRNGPVIGESGGRRYSLKWTARDPNNHEFEAFFELNRAKGWEGFRKALAGYGGATQNFVYADVEGNIGWQVAGKIPVRRKGDGSMPYDGTGTDGDWTGSIPFDDLPRLYNPPGGFIVTANQRIVGTAYKYPQLTRQFAPPWRARRIYELLSSNTKVTMNDVTDIQRDVFNIPVSAFAREVVRRGAASKNTLDLLGGWDGRMTADSKAAYVANELRGCAAYETALGSPPATPYDVREKVLHLALPKNDTKWLPKKFSSWDELLKTCDDRVADPDKIKKWGEEFVANFNHPLSAAPLIGGRFRAVFNNVDGSGQTPNVGAAVSMRHVSKPGVWDETRFVIPLGESGIPGSPHWMDQLEAWRTGTPAVLPFSDDAVMKSAETSLTMIPAP